MFFGTVICKGLLTSFLVLAMSMTQPAPFQCGYETAVIAQSTT